MGAFKSFEFYKVFHPDSWLFLWMHIRVLCADMLTLWFTHYRDCISGFWFVDEPLSYVQWNRITDYFRLARIIFNAWTNHRKFPAWKQDVRKNQAGQRNLSWHQHDHYHYENSMPKFLISSLFYAYLEQFYIQSDQLQTANCRTDKPISLYQTMGFYLFTWAPL